MYGNGVMIGTIRSITEIVQVIIRKDQVAVNTVFCAVAVGAATIATVVLLLAIGSILITWAMAAGFDVSGTSNPLYSPAKWYIICNSKNLLLENKKI